MSTEAHNVETEGSEATEVDKINTGALGTLVTVGLFAMVTICAAVAALVRHDIDAEESVKAADANQPVIALKASQRAVLNGPPGYLDRGKGVVSLPIDTAQNVVLGELAKDPNSATPVQADAGVTSAAAPAASGAAPGEADKKPEESGKSADEKKGAGAKPEMVKEQGGAAPAKPAQASSAHPAPPPLSPTAATPGAQAPGPLAK